MRTVISIKLICGIYYNTQTVKNYWKCYEMNFDDYMELFHNNCPKEAEYYLTVELQGEERIKKGDD